MMVPFPIGNDLEIMKNDDYIFGCVEEIKKKLSGLYVVNKFTFYYATKEKIIEYISADYNEYNDESFYLEDNTYVGINFKMSKENILVVYLIYSSAESI